MGAPDPVTLTSLIDDAKCFALVRQHRWPEGVRCPGYGGDAVVRHGCDDTQPQRQRYRCKRCAGRFDDLTGTVLAGHHQPRWQKGAPWAAPSTGRSAGPRHAGEGQATDPGADQC